jgi:hypothetical protein
MAQTIRTFDLAPTLTANGIAVDMAIAVTSGSPAFWFFMNGYSLQKGEGLLPLLPVDKVE